MLSSTYQGSEEANMVGHQNNEPSGDVRNDIKQSDSIERLSNAAVCAIDECSLSNNLQLINNKRLHYVIHACSSTSSTYTAE